MPGKLQRRAAAAAAGQQEKLDARAAAEQAKGKRQRGRKPKPPDAAVEPDMVANVSDPDSEIMKTRRGWVQGYNAQVVVTPEQIILAADLTTQANDVRQLTPMLDQALANVETVMGEEAVLGAAVADAGYFVRGQRRGCDRGMRAVHCHAEGPQAACGPAPGSTAPRADAQEHDGA